MAQVFFLNLARRDCKIDFELIPLSCDFLKVRIRIEDDNYEFYPSAAVGGQFSLFINALYCLYGENFGDQHGCSGRPCSHYSVKELDYNEEEDVYPCIVNTRVSWDEEGRMIDISFERCFSFPKYLYSESETVKIVFEWHDFRKEYTVDGRELCYAVAKACTEALKKYGFRGYFISTGSDICTGDYFDINQLLFIKAFGLDCFDARTLRCLWKKKWRNVYATSFEDELELLLFDM